MGVGSPGARMSIKDLPTDALLASLHSNAAPTPHIVDSWMTAQGYYPGTSRVRAIELYHRFRDWCAQQGVSTAEVLSRKKFGEALSTRLRRGRTRNYCFYYISRERQCVLDTLFQTGGPGNLGGLGPGG